MSCGLWHSAYGTDMLCVKFQTTLWTICRSYLHRNMYIAHDKVTVMSCIKISNNIVNDYAVHNYVEIYIAQDQISQNLILGLFHYKNPAVLTSKM